jgi:hypothetical protein
MDRDSAAKFVALAVVVRALVATHPDHKALRAALRDVAKGPFAGADDAMQEDIDLAVLNWLNGLRVEIRHSQD